MMSTSAASSAASTSAASPLFSSASSVTNRTLEDVGKAIISGYCNEYETTTTSYLLPPIVASQYPEERDISTNTIPKTKRQLRKPEEDQYTGLVINQAGEISEYKVFTLLHQLVNNRQNYQFISLKNVDLDNNNPKGVKEAALKNELPLIDLSNVKMNAEFDYIIIVKQVGVILVEVKTSMGGNNVSKAEKQLSNGKSFIDAVMGGVRGTGTSLVPVEKIIILPNETSPSPKSKTSNNSHQIHPDRFKDFPSVIDNIAASLKRTSSSSSFSEVEFKTFTRILIGLWSLAPTRKGISFNETLASVATQTIKIDEKVAQQEITSLQRESGTKSKYGRSVSAVESCPVTKKARNCKDICAIFLTPQQKNILDNVPRAIIDGAAGTGKTLVSLLKCISIVQNIPDARVLLIVPHPHDLRCQQILQSNDIITEIIETFPPLDTASSSVFIIRADYFFNISRSDLMKYDLTLYHTFMDDIQATVVYENCASFDDILEFLDQTYKSALAHNRMLWICIDVLQCGRLDLQEVTSPSHMMFKNDGSKRVHRIRTVQMGKVLRNSSDIIPVVIKARKERIDTCVHLNQLPPNTQFSEVRSGHQITSVPVKYHKLRQGTDAKFIEQFVEKIAADELKVLLKAQTELAPADVAILSDNLSEMKAMFKEFLKRINLSTQTIEDSLRDSSNSDKDKSIVMDSLDKVMSFEAPVVLYIRSKEGWVGDRDIYVAISRARTQLVIVDALTTDPPFTTENVTLVKWKEENGGFIRMQ